MSLEWYNKHIAPHVTPDFCDWWQTFYGPEEHYTATDTIGMPQDEARNEYFLRKGFAWHGWNARQQTYRRPSSTKYDGEDWIEPN